MKVIHLTWFCLQFDSIIPIQLNHPAQSPSALVASYLSNFPTQQLALKNQLDQWERTLDEQEDDKEVNSAKNSIQSRQSFAIPNGLPPANPIPKQAIVQPNKVQIQGAGEQTNTVKLPNNPAWANNRAMFQNSNGCACLPNDAACNNECIQQRMLQQASNVISCMSACAQQSLGAIQSCMQGCSNVYYAQVTAPIPTPVTETPKPSSAPSSTSSDTASSSTQQSSSTSSTSTSESASSTSGSSSSTESSSQTPTPTESKSASTPTATSASNSSTNGTVDGTDDDDDDDAATINGVGRTSILIVFTTLFILFFI